MLLFSPDSLSFGILSKNLKIKTIILPVLLCGCETWSLTIIEECRLKVFENRALRRISGPKRYANWEWRGLHSLYLSPNIVRMIKSTRLNWFAFIISTVVPSNICMFLSCRPFVVKTTLSTGLVGVEVTSVSWLEHLTVNCPSQETEVTSTPTRPVDNVVITTKGLQDRNIHIFGGTTVEIIKVN